MREKKLYKIIDDKKSIKHKPKKEKRCITTNDMNYKQIKITTDTDVVISKTFNNNLARLLIR